MPSLVIDPGKGGLEIVREVDEMTTGICCCMYSNPPYQEDVIGEAVYLIVKTHRDP